MYGMKWSNIDKLTVNNGYNFFHPFLSSQLIVIVLFPLLSIYMYPRIYYNDGKKRGCFYCFDADLRKAANVDEDNIALLEDIAREEMLMPDEMDLYRKGVLEYPNLQN